MSPSPSGPRCHYVAFPLTISWRSDFWSLPWYLPGLCLGEVSGLPPGLNLASLPLPPRRESLSGLGREFRPGELLQWQQYRDFLDRGEEEEGDIIQSLKGQPPPPRPVGLDPGVVWTLDWHLETFLADQDVDLGRVADQQDDLAALIAPEEWDEDSRQQAAAWQDPLLTPTERFDPELLKLRLEFWWYLAAPHLSRPAALICLEGRTGRSLADWHRQQPPAEGGSDWLEISLPLVQDPAMDGAADFAPRFAAGLATLLEAVSRRTPGIEDAHRELEALAAREVTSRSGESRPAALTLAIWSPIPGPETAPVFLPAGFDLPLILWLPRE